MSSLPSLLASGDVDPQETREWLDALEAVIEQVGPERAHYLIERLIDVAHRTGINLPYSATTEYINTIPPDRQITAPGDYAIENRIRAYVRWNALAMVLRANQDDSGLGGHIASFASAATLFDVGYNHFWHSIDSPQGSDLVFVQGHSAPGVYARAFMLGGLTEDQLNNFRREVDGKGLSSYPHPWLMPDFWQFPTVSMGLGPLQAIYQARFMKYLQDRGLSQTEGRKVWAFMGDGEMDEPESMGAIGMAGREKLDNLVFVVNCNLQRLDGPVRGNGKIIQELESDFRGAGWNVIKVIWGSYWDPLLAQDKTGLLRQRMMECVDGDYQTFKSRDGAYVRQHFFGKYPELAKMVANWSDEDIWRLNRGGHDPHKVHAAYHAAVNHKGQPTVILAKTIKGYGMGESGEAQNITHQQKKMGTVSIKAFRDRFKLPIKDDELESLPFLKFEEGSPELNYMRERRQALGGFLAKRRRAVEPLPVPPLSAFEAQLKGGGEGREFSTTMAFVRILNVLLKDKLIGKRVVPIVVDESRTFGMEGLFRQIGIWNQEGQKYVPQDADQLMFYKESKTGQILQEGINEAGAMASWMAAATSYSNHDVQMIPFYVFYSMFGFQRFGDLAWAAGDSRARGFLVGGTSGRTTLNGEGLQHEDGHSQILAATVPNCMAYDPTFAYEVAVIIQDGLHRMVAEQQDVYYYLTVLNENYEHPAMPEGAAPDIIKGMYQFRKGAASNGPRVQLLGSGSIFREAIAAAELLRSDWGVESDLWGCPSFNELARDGQDCARWNLLHPKGEQRVPHVSACLADSRGPVIAATDYMKLYAEQIRAFVPRNYRVLGTDGFGRSDTREKLRHFFEVDRHWITLAALRALADEGALKAGVVAEAIAKYGLDTDKPNPLKV
ncbi:pyruvate dehydrogenase (acetyl-transferring), homodimeric type [Denitratisoma oestradiolicum]|uniref:Pyruvate dehydrogenase E1 component n=1 Tax=Denitratisoma oestradiolicum TaxID=311182 RepID=A0A6S6XX65_9PROT|nr:pyruvate dehydrogenase (acetyl-transferring), homodimeric type [Denitratisoma oestradiolicum]TWO81486.1 pyruvate dehydrogenase (acetyl-transferring), homodimeric type [Denitratisoma oestradiolicum]CAB1368697.1 pyruvate dehydrogenase, decarboxylase component E1, thiamin-binding [Denitratisoma oestradiolicum]